MFKYLKEDPNKCLQDHKNLPKKLQVKTIPEMKVRFNKEIESPKKTQDEIKREVKNSGWQTKTSYESLNNRLKDMEDRVLDLEDKVEEMNISAKESVKY